jgi:hypothetical protein
MISLRHAYKDPSASGERVPPDPSAQSLQGRGSTTDCPHSTVVERSTPDRTGVVLDPARVRVVVDVNAPSGWAGRDVTPTVAGTPGWGAGQFVAQDSAHPQSLIHYLACRPCCHASGLARRARVVTTRRHARQTGCLSITVSSITEMHGSRAWTIRALPYLSAISAALSRPPQRPRLETSTRPGRPTRRHPDDSLVPS